MLTFVKSIGIYKVLQNCFSMFDQSTPYAASVSVTCLIDLVDYDAI